MFLMAIIMATYLAFMGYIDELRIVQKVTNIFLANFFVFSIHPNMGMGRVGGNTVSGSFLRESTLIINCKRIIYK